jgi:hypothetical protein
MYLIRELWTLHRKLTSSDKVCASFDKGYLRNNYSTWLRVNDQRPLHMVLPEVNILLKILTITTLKCLEEKYIEYRII